MVYLSNITQDGVPTTESHPDFIQAFRQQNGLRCDIDFKKTVLQTLIIIDSNFTKERDYDLFVCLIIYLPAVTQIVPQRDLAER